MSKALYTSINGTARKCREMYTVQGSTTRKIKKGYCVVGGVTHKFFGKELRYYGVLNTLGYQTIDPLGSANSKYALFAIVNERTTGGASYINHGVAFNNKLTRSETEIPNKVREGKGLASPNHAFFAGGYQTGNPDTNQDTVLPYDTSLTQKTAENLLQGRVRTPAGALIGDYALFGGSENYTDSATYRKVSVYHSTTLTQSEASLTRTLYGVKGADNGTYAVFAGGFYKEEPWASSKASYTAVGFNASITRVEATALRKTTAPGFAVRAGDYAVFIGSTQADAYGKDLTKVSVSALSLKRSGVAAVTLDQYGLCAGGWGNSNDSPDGIGRDTDVVDVYDASLTRQTITSMSIGRSATGAVIGDYALFAGGNSDTSIDSSTVDVYTVD